MLVSATDMLNAAARGHYAVAAFNTNNLEWAAYILDAAEETQSPVIIQCTSGAAKWQVSFKVVADIVRDLVEAKNITVPVALHLDHGTDEDYVERAVRLGFSSVMLDASTDSFEDNIRRTAAVVRMAHPLDITVEAEIGHVGSGTDADDDAVYTEVEEAAAFAEQTGVDSLAVSIGTAHGIYKKFAPVLSFDRLAELRARVDIPLVLHGGSGTGDDNIARCVAGGICKVNVYTEFLLAGADALRGHAELDLHGMKAAAAAAMSDVLEHYYRICGSAAIK